MDECRNYAEEHNSSIDGEALRTVVELETMEGKTLRTMSAVLWDHRSVAAVVLPPYRSRFISWNQSKSALSYNIHFFCHLSISNNIILHHANPGP